jgi:iron complex outermembrane receptor protein
LISNRNNKSQLKVLAREIFMFKITVLSLLVASTAVVTNTSLAQDEDGAEGFVLEEILVTARKRVESLQDTPISIAAFTAIELNQRQIRSTDQLADVTANLTFDAYSPSSGQNASSQIYIRGIGQSDFTAVTDPGVGLYVDGVYYARSFGGTIDFLDLERIEVLRGPQGTLFGRNTIGGLVALHTVRPHDEFSASAEVIVGSDSMFYVTGHINIPISDGLYTKIGVTSRNRDGYVKRVQLAERQLSGIPATTDGVDLGDDDSVSVRASLVWEASDNLSFFLSADYTNEDENGSPATSLGLNDESTFPAHTNQFENGLAFGGNCPLFPPPHDGPSANTNNNFMCINDTWRRDEFENEGNAEVSSELKMWGISLEVNWDAADWMSIKSITAYRDFDAYSARDADGTPYQVFHTQDPFEQNQFSQEFQFSGDTGNLTWLAGLYYFEEEADNPNPVQLPVPTIGQIVSGGQVDNDNFAVFGQLTYNFTDQWALTGGIRYTDETKRFRPYSFADGNYTQGGPGSPFVRFHDCPTGQEPGCDGVNGRLFTDGDRLLPDVESKLTFNDWTPMLNLAYFANEDVMIYGSWSEGFKSGGFDQRFINWQPAPSSFDPETATTFEIGLKSSLLDNTLRFNVAAFHTDYKDMQIIVRQGFAPLTFNAGEAKIKGFEIESTWIPTPAWIIQASLGYINAKYSKLDESVETVGITKDSKLPQTPQWSANIGVGYTTRLGNWNLTPRVDWVYTDDVYNNAVNTPQLLQDSYSILNAAIILQSDNEAWEFILAGRNLTDEIILISGSSGYETASGYLTGTYARKREWSLSAKYSF